MLYGSTKYNVPSRFIGELPEECCKSLVKPVARNVNRFERPANALKKPVTRGFTFGETSKKSTDTFSVGDQVKHRAFGDGMIISLKPMGNDVLMEISFDKVGTKKIMANMGAVKKI